MRRTTCQQYGVLGSFHRPCPPAFSGFRADVVHRSAESVGGDFYYVASPQFGRATVLFGDACGKGPQAADWVHRIGWSIRQLCRAGLPPSELLSRLNAATCHALPDDRFITATCIELDAVAKRVVVSNAGHVPPIVLRGNGGAGIVGRASGPPLGVHEDAEYRESTIGFDNGSTMVLMTDGILEPFEVDLENMTTALGLVSESHGEPLLRIGQKLLERATAEEIKRDDCMLMSLGLDASQLNPSTRFDRAS